MNLSILYRGPLSSCNYACGYCPFSKRKETAPQLERDRAALARFTAWIADQSGHRWKILFTPWGEALVRRWYRNAIVELSHLPQIESVAAQTNLSGRLSWIEDCQADRVSFWATWHPTETPVEPFLKRIQRVHELGVRICVGVVGVPEFLPEIAGLRERLPRGIYLWINAQQPRRRPYTEAEIDRFRQIDPQFQLTLRRFPSFGKPCRTGEVTFTVDGKGDMRRCHFVDDVIGNIYDPDWLQALHPRSCPNRYCDCFLGKSQFASDALTPFFGSTALERLPAGA